MFLLSCRHVFEYLNGLLLKLCKQKQLSSVHYLTKDVHVWPDYHGNRSPIADVNIKGMICGLTLSPTEENLAIVYLAFIQALAVSRRAKMKTYYFLSFF